MPLTSESMTACLRSSVLSHSTAFGSTMTPNSPASLTVRTIAAVSNSSLAGMQPRLRQVPPYLSNSMMRDVQPGGRPVERRCIATRAAADDHYVEMCVHVGSLPTPLICDDR